LYTPGFARLKWMALAFDIEVVSVCMYVDILRGTQKDTGAVCVLIQMTALTQNGEIGRTKGLFRASDTCTVCC
jgi:hypothetical protein